MRWNSDAVWQQYAQVLQTNISPEQMLEEFQIARGRVRRGLESVPVRRFGFSTAAARLHAGGSLGIAQM
eukprot:369254-Alexandrium_andersonii.AAC.1